MADAEATPTLVAKVLTVSDGVAEGTRRGQVRGARWSNGWWPRASR